MKRHPNSPSFSSPTPLAIVALVVFLAVGIPRQPQAAGVPHTITEQPGKHFARDVVARADQGWRLLWIKVGGTDDQLRIELTMGKKAQAEIFALSFSDDDGKVRQYWRTITAPPKEKRTYVIEKDIIDTLRDGPITALEFGCVHPFIESTNRAVAVDPDAYYQVVARHRGKKAQRRLASEIARSLKYGSFGGGDRVDKQTVAFTMIDQHTTEVLAHLGKRGEVESVEVRTYPLPQSWRTYGAGNALNRELRTRQRVTAVSLSGNDLTLKLAGGKQVVLADDDFTLDEASACGC